MNTPQELADLGAGPHSATSVVINDGSTSPDLLSSSQNGPFVYVEGESTTPEAASAVVKKAQDKLREELVARQKALNAPPITYLSMVDVISPTAPVTKMTVKLQLTGVALLLVLLLGLGGAYAVTGCANPASCAPPTPWPSSPALPVSSTHRPCGSPGPRTRRS
ncbi:hypothetical protein [Kutzneria kofuensis]|uniref:hypothetical protein n=1 Tax=Kutzneria kofuensis TaxID=103725 RepID=UPI0031EBB669